MRLKFTKLNNVRIFEYIDTSSLIRGHFNMSFYFFCADLFYAKIVLINLHF